MKKLLSGFLCVMLFIPALFCQDVFISPDTTFERQSLTFEFTGIIQMDTTITKDQLYQKVRQWFAEAFNSSKNVIDNADKDEGVIYGKGAFIMRERLQGYVEYNISVRCKKGKAKYLITNFNQKSALQVNAFRQSTPQSLPFDMGRLSQKESTVEYGATGMGENFRNKTWISIKSQAKEQTFNLIQSLKTNLRKESINEKDSW